jgi:dihydropteroate synthase
MGIVNLNDDSFSGDGTLEAAAALAQAEQMLRDGADIIDIGAESARTNRAPITVEQEVARLAPFMEAWPEVAARCAARCARFSAFSARSKRFSAPPPPTAERPETHTTNDPPLLSINTWRSEVISQVLPLGGDILNDISALSTPRNAELCAQHGAALLIMHSVGQPKVPHTHIGYPDVMAELEQFFEAKIGLALAAGLSREQILLDPGIDFAKQRADNLRIYRDLERLHRFERPILLPVSRKTVIGDLLGLPDPRNRDAGTLACIAVGLRRGAHIFRVHNVPAAAQALKVLWRACPSPMSSTR